MSKLASVRLRAELFSNAGARLVTAASAFAVLAIAAHTLPPSDFVFFATLTAAYGAIGLADLGIGSASQHLVSGVSAQQGRKTWTTATILITSACLLAWPLVLLLSQLTSHPSLALLSGSIALFTVPLSTLDRWRAQRQEAWISAAIATGASLITVATTAYAAIRGVGVDVTIIPVAVTLIFQLGHGAVVALKRRSTLRLAFDAAVGRRLLRRGSSFLVLQVNAAVIFQLDVIIVVALLADEALGGFPVASRLMVAGAAVLGSATSALWPHMERARRRGETREGLLHALRVTSILVSGLALGAVLAAVGLFDVPIAWAFGATAAPDSGMVASVGVFLCVFTAANATAHIATAFDAVGQQVWCAIASTSLKLLITPLAVLAIGPSAAILAGALALLAATLIPLLLTLKRMTGPSWLGSRVPGSLVDGATAKASEGLAFQGAGAPVGLEEIGGPRPVSAALKSASRASRGQENATRVRVGDRNPKR
jgi:O-antigen/teichoic acid export membrane protein